ncbi:MAG TPA: hypothetical protein VLJ57_20840 [Burkholderiaceae bacterium]|nr:hypothetical protein [Burkholderiaceae bacterium]
MEVNSATGSRPPVEAVKQRPPVQQADPVENETKQLATQEARKTAEAPPKPVVNLQGQTIGGNVNTTA